MKKQLCATWQPIETAPTDGEDVLLFASYSTSESSKLYHEIGSWDYYYSRWISNGGQKVCPTHWMPLPQSPEADQ